MTKYLFYFVLIAGLGNTVLRPEIENPLTLYRVVAPLAFAFLFLRRPVTTTYWLCVFAVFVGYNFVLAAAYGNGYEMLYPSIVHYFYLFLLLVLMLDMRRHYLDFDNQFLRFIKGFYLFLLANLAVEFALGTTIYPNLYVDETGESSLRAFYWNQNDLAVVLCIVAWCALTLDRYRGYQRALVVLLTVGILYYNDSKSALISFLFVSIPIWATMRVCSRIRVGAAVGVPMIAALATLLVIALVLLRDVSIEFANSPYTVGDLLVTPAENILTLQASGERWGSLNNRADAAIFVIKEYLHTFGFGLGAGGSWLVLSLPQYELGGAQSPHNALLQFTVDFGYPVLLGYLILVYWALRRLFRYRIGEADRLKVMAILSFPLLGLSQSGAIVTNYFFFASVYFIWFYGRQPQAAAAATDATIHPVHPAAARPAQDPMQEA